MPPLDAPTVQPFLTARFVLDIGTGSGSFSKCAGLAGEVSVEEYQEGGENRFVHRFPSRASFPNLVLSQGAGPARGLWEWFYEFYVTGTITPRDGTVVLYSTVDGSLEPVRVWAFTRGWPVKLAGPDLDAQSSSVAIDALEIAHHGLVLR